MIFYSKHNEKLLCDIVYSVNMSRNKPKGAIEMV